MALLTQMRNLLMASFSSLKPRERSLFETPTATIELQQVAVVHEAVEERSRHDAVRSAVSTDMNKH